jgi:hypothetical protein
MSGAGGVCRLRGLEARLGIGRLAGLRATHRPLAHRGACIDRRPCYAAPRD